MTIEIKNSHPTVRLDTLSYGDVFTTPYEPTRFYILIEPDYELDPDDGNYCVDLKNGCLYCYENAKDVIPVKFEATASF